MQQMAFDAASTIARLTLFVHSLNGHADSNGRTREKVKISIVFAALHVILSYRVSLQFLLSTRFVVSLYCLHHRHKHKTQSKWN